MDDCIFCKIADKKISANVVYEDGEVLAFRDINPQAPVHILLIPKKHIPSFMDIVEADKGLIAAIYKAAQKIAGDASVDKKGFRLVVNNGQDAGQAVAHLHFHLLGGRKFSWPPG
ncbi:MAG: histidine triad nucleotide-binding protein [Elusimicrobia bacterium]|nr:histidine triad nucleotide-binding protein [Elusimicrobiota bacterium]